jgi:hypothetical protein
METDNGTWIRTFEWGVGVFLTAPPEQEDVVSQYFSGMGTSDRWHVLDEDDSVLVVVSWDTRYPYLGWEVFDRNDSNSTHEGIFQESQFDELFENVKMEDMSDQEIAEHVYQSYIQHVICG